MSRIDPWRRRAAHPGPAEGHGPWRVGWSGPGRAAGMALAVRSGVAAARAGPDRVGSRARRSGAAARATWARGRGLSSRGGVGIPQAGAPLAASVGPRQRVFSAPRGSESGASSQILPGVAGLSSGRCGGRPRGRGGRPELGDGGPSRDGAWRPGRGLASGDRSVCPRQWSGGSVSTLVGTGAGSPIGTRCRRRPIRVVTLRLWDAPEVTYRSDGQGRDPGGVE